MALQFKLSQREAAISMRWHFPYGTWICADGREVLYNRRYKPIWQRYPGQKPTVADPDECVSFRSVVNIGYDDSNPPWRDLESRAVCKALLTEWGVPADWDQAGRWEAALSEWLHDSAPPNFSDAEAVTGGLKIRPGNSIEADILARAVARCLRALRCDRRRSVSEKYASGGPGA